ncbi:MAG: HU family DNA-binding protein [Chlamydiia bacterium]|nr:HU family DNA-binding protein [Chlamydiia bacterium]
MNKAQLVEALASKTGASKADAERSLNAFIETILEQTAKGTKVAVSGLGSFERVQRKARKGINPATKEVIQIKAKKAPKFKAAKAFKDAVL